MLSQKITTCNKKGITYGAGAVSQNVQLFGRDLTRSAIPEGRNSIPMQTNTRPMTLFKAVNTFAFIFGANQALLRSKSHTRPNNHQLH
jgi:hypothetical protein